MAATRLAVELGGTLVRAALFVRKAGRENQWEMVREPVRYPTPPSGVKDVLSTMLITSNGALGNQIPEAIGISSPGPLDLELGVVHFTPNIHDFKNVPLRAYFEQQFGVRTVLDNDGNCGALGEAWFGAGRGHKVVLYVTVSTGIGGGLVHEGKLFRGHNGNAVEVGHIKMDNNIYVPTCGCGDYGCLETWSSGTAIARMAQALVNSGVKTIIREGAADITAEHVSAAARRGDIQAQRVLRIAIEKLGEGIVTLLHAYNPSCVVIGGGLSNMGKDLIDPLQTVINERTMPPNRAPIVLAELDAPGLWGALALTCER